MDYEIDLDAKDWIESSIEKESHRLKELGLKPLVLSPKNFGIIIKDKKLVNRIEIDSGFDFEARVNQILLSEPIAYPHKQDYFYAHVVLLTPQPNLPLLVPYLYPKQIQEEEKMLKNDLKEWLFINAKGHRARHSIHGDFHAM